MRPSVTEQLEGLRRILEEVIAPELSDPYPRDILAGVCATLESLAGGWQQVPGFLDWDTRASAAVLEQVAAAGHGEAPGSGELEPINVEPIDVDPFDFEALEARHRDVRAALERAVPAIAEREELSALRTQLAQLFRERGQRYPLKTVWRAPAPSAPSSE